MSDAVQLISPPGPGMRAVRLWAGALLVMGFCGALPASAQEAPPPGARPTAPRRAPAQPAPQVPPPAAPAERSQNQAPQNVPQDVTPGSHVLSGVWKVFWLEQNKSTELRIGQVFPSPTVTTFVGGMATLAGEACPLTGSVIDNLAGRFVDGLEDKVHSLSAFAVLRAQCPSGQIWIEALGLPAGKVQMTGRATFITPDGSRTYAPVALGR